MSTQPLLEIDDLHIAFSTPRGVAHVVNGVSMRLEAGRMHGLVGESGSGKSVTARAVLGLVPQGSLARLDGAIRLDGRDILRLPEKALGEQIRGRQIAMVFQDPMTALNPVMRVGHQIALPLRRHFSMSRKEAWAKALGLLDQVGIPDPAGKATCFPHELSGGQRQRIMIAVALSCDPQVLIADEPTTALDVTVQAQILDLFDQLRAERGLTVLMVSHDLNLIAERCEDVSVMYAGRVIENGSSDQTFERPLHPYTELLQEAKPTLGDAPHTLLKTIPGQVPDLTDLPDGCPFAARCPDVQPDCHTGVPLLIDHGIGRAAACKHPRDSSRAAHISSATPGALA